MRPINQDDYCMTIVKELPKKGRRKYARFMCECGNTIDTRMDSVKSGKTKSCGCARKTPHKKSILPREKLTDGINRVKPHYNSANEVLLVPSSSRLYGIWIKIKDRCLNPKHKHYNYYGGRGITICDEWLENNNKFFKWALENGYTDELTIDRNNYNGNYEPNNCSWRTRSFQSQNTRLLSTRNKTGYRGVSKNRDTAAKPFRARIGFEGKQYRLGEYYTELEAAKAYDAWVVINNTHHTKNDVELFNHIHLREKHERVRTKRFGQK